MRKTSVRKFIHMVIDILPLLIIPIFALNILHKETEPISIEVQEQISVDFNQLMDVKDQDGTSNGIHINTTNGLVTIDGTSTTSQFRYIGFNTQCNLIENHYYILKTLNGGSNSTYLTFFYNGSYYGNFTGDTKFQALTNYNNFGIQFSIRNANVTFTNVQFYFQLYDLTQMGLEDLSVNEFNVMYPDSHYNFTESQKMLVDKPSPTTYDDTDIGSQFVYALYKPVHDYFNFNNLFNMGAIYNWIELNLFSGTVPLPIFIIWNVIVYEFFVDLIFLLYGVFMFIIDFAEKCLERPFRR